MVVDLLQIFVIRRPSVAAAIPTAAGVGDIGEDSAAVGHRQQRRRAACRSDRVDTHRTHAPELLEFLFPLTYFLGKLLRKNQSVPVSVPYRTYTY